MRRSLALAVLFCVMSQARAQVSTDDRAIDALPSAPKTSTPTPKPATTHAARHHAKPATPRPPPLKAPTMPVAPPPNPVIQPPPFVMPAHKPPPPPPPVPVKPAAAGSAQATKDGPRITFGANSADLNPETYGALVKIAAAAKAAPTMRVTLTAYAPGKPDDPSTPRRLSLDRALAARAVLLQEGVLSDHIYARAMGTEGIGTDPPDRLDITEQTPPPPPAAPAAPAPK